MATIDEKVEEVRVLLENSPGMSLRKVGMASNISLGSAHTIARSLLNLYPYKIKILHKLKPQDFEKRLKFANWFLSNDSIEDYFIASDEAYFHLDGTVNNYNFRIWSSTPPDYIVEKEVFPKKVLVWCGISK